MLKVTINNKLGQIKVGRTSFDIASMREVKKVDFDKKYKKILDIKQVWPLLREALKEVDKNKETSDQEQSE